MAQTCNKCGKRSYSKLCFRHKPKPKIRRQSLKTAQRNNLLRKKWYKTNLPIENDKWECYLQISQYCPKLLTKGMLTLEHVEPKVKRPDLIFTVSNIRPSCSYCNAIKGSKTLEKLSKTYPQLNKYLLDKD
jgi:5-methylcytosine-specific restriction endonuclease McrA